MLVAGTTAMASPSPSLRLTADRTAETVLTIKTSTVLTPGSLTANGSGRVAGFAVTALGGGGFIYGELRVTRWTTPGGPLQVRTGSDPVRLSAGRYRLVVFADAPVTLTIPLRAGRAVSLRVAGRTQASAHLENLLASGPVVAPSARRTVRYAGSWLLSHTYFRAQAHQAEVVAQCFAPTAENAQTCAQQLGYTSVFTSPGSVGDGYTSAFAAVYDGTFRAGTDCDVLLQAVNVDAPSFAERLVVNA